LTVDFALARSNMVKSQILPHDIIDETVLAGFEGVARERFVDPEYRELAYSDYPVPIADRRHFLTPMQTGKLIEGLRVQKGDAILVVGAGTGYEAAVLARMGARVHAVESDASLSERAQQLLAQQIAAEQVRWKTGELAAGWAECAPFAGVLFCGAVRSVPNQIIGQLDQGGRVVAIVASADQGIMRATRYTLEGSDRPVVLFDTVAAYLPGLGPDNRFVL
jgi:protein-L-isoaspartate(D-aspartate) O-methyltransferase